MTAPCRRRSLPPCFPRFTAADADPAASAALNATRGLDVPSRTGARSRVRLAAPDLCAPSLRESVKHDGGRADRPRCDGPAAVRPADESLRRFRSLIQHRGFIQRRGPFFPRIPRHGGSRFSARRTPRASSLLCSSCSPYVYHRPRPPGRPGNWHRARPSLFPVDGAPATSRRVYCIEGGVSSRRPAPPLPPAPRSMACFPDAARGLRHRPRLPERRPPPAPGDVPGTDPRMLRASAPDSAGTSAGPCASGTAPAHPGSPSGAADRRTVEDPRPPMMRARSTDGRRSPEDEPCRACSSHSRYPGR